MLFQRNSAFSYESTSNIALRRTDSLPLSEGFGLWQAQSEDNDEDRWACTEPEQGSPAVRRGIDKTTSKHRGKEVAKSIPLLQHPAYDTSCCLRAVL